MVGEFEGDLGSRDGMEKKTSFLGALNCLENTVREQPETTINYLVRFPLAAAGSVPTMIQPEYNKTMEHSESQKPWAQGWSIVLQSEEDLVLNLMVKGREPPNVDRLDSIRIADKC